MGEQKRPWEWTGFKDRRITREANQEVVPGKTLWDWLQLLVVPLVLIIGGFIFNTVQANRDRADFRKQSALQRGLERDSQREQILTNYLSAMTSLLLNEGLGNYGDPPPSGAERDLKVRVVARILTLGVLPRLDPERKGLVLRFLASSSLITFERPEISLEGADFSHADLSGIPLSFIELDGANFTDADFSGARLTGVAIRNADMTGASLRGAFLDTSTIEYSKFNHADLADADFTAAKIRYTTFIGADLSDAQFLNARLTACDLTDARVTGARFRYANLYETDLPAGVGSSGVSTSTPSEP